MPNETPDLVKPYIFHGVDLTVKSEGDSSGVCPVCLKSRFYVSNSTGQYNCKSCGESGNIYTFLTLLWQQSYGQPTDYSELAAERRLNAEALHDWGFCLSHLTGEWIVPGYNQDGAITNLYRWAEVDDGKGNLKHRLLSTPGCKNAMLGLGKWKEDALVVYICEGAWDGVSLYHALGHSRLNDKGNLVPTTAKETSLLAKGNVVAVPGCESFKPVWGNIMADKEIVLLYHNDHPKISKTGKQVGLAGYRGLKKTTSIFNNQTLIHYLRWDSPTAEAGLPLFKALNLDPSKLYYEKELPAAGEDESIGFDKALPSGFDLRDALNPASSPNSTLGDRTARLRALWARLSQVPKAWYGTGEQQEDDTRIKAAPCTRYSDLRNSWRKSLSWTESLDTALTVMLACVASTKMQGDQLWIRVMGRPGTAKTTLCEAIGVAEDYVYSNSIMTGLHSGYAHGADEEGNKDASLIPKMNNKTSIWKEADTLLTASNRDQTLGQFRDIYDGVSRTQYKNRVGFTYKGLRISVILAGTRSLRKLNRSCLGDRFLDVIIHTKGHDALEEEIEHRAAFNQLRRMRLESDGKAESQYDPKLYESMALTGGYVTWLRQNAPALSAALKFSPENVKYCSSLGKFVAYMRARPDKENEEDGEQEAELATRLSSQFVRLAGFAAIVMNKDEVDDEVLKLVTEVCHFTSDGLPFKITKALYDRPNGLEVRIIARMVHKTEITCRKYLVFMKELGIVGHPVLKSTKGVKGRSKGLWTLTKKVRDLYTKISSPPVPEETTTEA